VKVCAYSCQHRLWHAGIAGIVEFSEFGEFNYLLINSRMSGPVR